MLSISKIGGGRKYHQYLAGEYYLGTEGPEAVFSGCGAEKLGLTGEVSERSFRRLAAGFSTKGKHPKPLVRNAGEHADPAKGKRGHVQGWDLTFSAPKSVSVLWAVADKEVRAAIIDCHRQAVADAVKYLEDEATWSRRGKGGGVRVKAQLVAAAFGHGTNRELEPQLHTHVIAFNVCVRIEDGKTGTLDSRYLYRHKMTAGALYRASLAAALSTRLGLSIRPAKVGFYIVGTPEDLCERWSTRRKQVLDALRSFGSYSPQAAAVAAHTTKKSKGTERGEQLAGAWRAVGREFGFSTPEADAICRNPPRERASAKELEVAIARARKKLLEQTSHFSEQDFVREAARESVGIAADAETIRAAVRDRLRTPAYIRLGERKGEERFTTRETIALEKRMLDGAERLAKKGGHRVKPRALRKLIEKQFPTAGKAFSEEHLDKNRELRNAVRYLLEAGDLKVLSGMAGTGKTKALKACHEEWKNHGYTVIGTAVAGKAARGLETASGIESQNLARLLVRLDAATSVWGKTKLHARNLWRVARGKKPFAPYELTKDNVLVVDEAGMVGTRQMARLIYHARKGGAKLVLVGDERQLQPIEAGGPFAKFVEQFEAARLTRIVRQSLDPTDKEPDWKRRAVTELSAGEAVAGLTRYAERGFVTVKKDRGLAREALVADWVNAGGPAKPVEHLIFASTNEDVRLLNLLCQRARGAPSPSEIMRKGVKGQEGEVILPGDRVMFTQRSPKLQVENGDLGTVRDVTGSLGRKVLVVDMDDTHATVVVPTHLHTGLRLGYAMTTHKGQGVTCEHAYVLAGGPMQDRHLTYVQASRARETTRFYVDRFEAGPNLERLSALAQQERKKDLAHDVYREAGQRSHSHTASHSFF